MNDTKIADIVAATGVPKATLYEYFSGKEAILDFLLEKLLHDMAEEVDEAARAGALAPIN